MEGMSEQPDADVAWRGLIVPTFEYCRLTHHTLAGTVVFPNGTLSYEVVCDDDWRTQSTRVSGWLDRAPVSIEILDAETIDLAFSPSTNTIPIRRLNLAIGEEARVTATWLRFPSLTLAPLEQTYRRLGERTWQYSSGTFTARLEVDAFGLVRRYEGGWEELR